MFVFWDIFKNNDWSCYLFWEGWGVRVLLNLMNCFNVMKWSVLGLGNLIKFIDRLLVWLENLGMGEVCVRENWKKKFIYVM